MSRLTWLSGAVAWAVWLTLTGFVANPRPAASAEVAPGFRVDVVATGVPRPIQLALDPRGRLVVLSSGWFGDAAGEIYRLDLRAPLPIDASRVPRVVIPFADQIRKAVLGSLAVDPRSGNVFLGEENGNRIYRLGDAPAAVAQLPRRRRISGPTGLPHRSQRGSAASTAGRSARPDLSAQASRSPRPRAAVATHRRDRDAGRRPRVPEL